MGIYASPDNWRTCSVVISSQAWLQWQWQATVSTNKLNDYVPVTSTSAACNTADNIDCGNTCVQAWQSQLHVEQRKQSQATMIYLFYFISFTRWRHRSQNCQGMVTQVNVTLVIWLWSTHWSVSSVMYRYVTCNQYQQDTRYLILCRQCVNPLKFNSSDYYTLPYRPNLPFLISDIRALWRSRLSIRVPKCQKVFNFWHLGTLVLSPECQSARMSEIKNGRLGLYGAEHLKCNHMMTLDFKGLN